MFGVETMLVYGYDLGGAHNGWLLNEVDAQGELRVPWYSPGVEPQSPACAEAADEALRSWISDSPIRERPTWEERRRQRELEDEVLNVEFLFHGHSDHPHLLMVARGSVTRVKPGNTRAISPGTLDAPAEWGLKLRQALAVLGLTPLQERPQWLLCTSCDDSRKLQEIEGKAAA